MRNRASSAEYRLLTLSLSFPNLSAEAPISNACAGSVPKKSPRIPAFSRGLSPRILIPDFPRPVNRHETIYASWEIGSAENCNRFVRRWYTKGTDFGKCTTADMHRLERVINSIHRRLLDGKTAYKFDTAFAKAA